jgi:hypothetical protein
VRFLWWGKKPPIKKKPRLSVYTVHPIRCEVCGKPFKNGDLLFTFDHMQGDKKVGEHTTMAHADCLVKHPDRFGMISAPFHDDYVALSEEQWAAWKQAVGVGAANHD